jgi:hypothetical protein
MSAILDIRHSLLRTPALHLAGPLPTRYEPSTAVTVGGDTIELSPVGRVLSEAAAESSLRLARIRAIREEIDTGTFETPRRIDGTVSRLLDVLA